MNKQEAILLGALITLLSYSCYLLGQGNPVIEEKIVQVKVYDKGFCVSCYKEHNWDEMYVVANRIDDSIVNTD